MRRSSMSTHSRRNPHPAHVSWSNGLVRRALGLLLIVSFVPAATNAQESPDRVADPSRDWRIYANPEIAIYGHTGKGNSSATQITGPRVANPSTLLGDLGRDIALPERSREQIMSALVGATFGMMTPGLDVASRPRLFADFNLSVPIGTEAQLARKGDPGQLSLPPERILVNRPVGEGVVRGIGTQITAVHQGPQIHAGLGVSTEYDIGNDQWIRLKPAVVYSRTILDIKAQTRRAVRLNNDFGANQNLDDFRFILLDDERTEVYHAIGPSMELEYEPGLRWGPFVLSLYTRGHAAYILNTLETEMQQCNVSGGQPEECASWKYKQDRWTYRATAGIHLTWGPTISR